LKTIKPEAISMSGNKMLKAYQQTLIDAYYDHKNHQVLDPLYEAFQQWKRGEITHDDITELIHKVHKENQKIYSLFTQGRDFLITCIKFDADWFANWYKANPPPAGVEL
jgi:hypothetical protein